MDSQQMAADIVRLAEEIRTLFKDAQRRAAVNVNIAMLSVYWQIGRRIAEQEQSGETRAGYGQYLIVQLSKRLVAEFGKGFSVPNLKNFRQFYLVFPDFEIGYALRSQLSWTHYRLIMRVDNPAARTYYVSETASQFWSTRTLERNINSLYYERLLSTQGQASNDEPPPAATGFIKDPYMLEFWERNSRHLHRKATWKRLLSASYSIFCSKWERASHS
ncbi:DUF1016 N-terminal domain-containing protein [Chitinophaga sedimenti]|uniref:DUF1016 N-terminal domain-containing protein n=1 Tax=Chitinophaga sedimenti TaxID=2033606 RepID=UPI00200420B9|nr:DUF1016 N-terminal domain-containing protein [Chitinophaga sedimenti]MCK7555038.1 DUF1016 N-terminal domain-containing protein [Chitinophaga sedimenti]